MTDQISLFDNISTTKEEFAQRICDECNKLDTFWKNQFYVDSVVLEWWDHVQLKNRVLNICIKARNRNDKSNFVQFQGDKESQLTLNNITFYSEYISKLTKDKDFAFIITPWNIFVFYHNWELKKV